MDFSIGSSVQDLRAEALGQEPEIVLDRIRPDGPAADRARRMRPARLTYKDRIRPTRPGLGFRSASFCIRSTVPNARPGGMNTTNHISGGDFEIDETFAKLLRPHFPEEAAALETEVRRDGKCRDAIVIGRIGGR